MTRQEANFQIIQILSDLVVVFPEQRFTQLLLNADILTRKDSESLANEYNLESEKLLERMSNSSIVKEIE